MHMFQKGKVSTKMTKNKDVKWLLAEGDLKVLEVGSFSCAGLYDCDTDLVVNSINSLILEIAEDESS